MVIDTILRYCSEYINVPIISKDAIGSVMIFVNFWRNEMFLLRLLKLIKIEWIFSKLRNKIACKVSWYILSNLTLNIQKYIPLEYMKENKLNVKGTIHIIGTWVKYCTNWSIPLLNVLGKTITSWLNGISSWFANEDMQCWEFLTSINLLRDRHEVLTINSYHATYTSVHHNVLGSSLQIKQTINNIFIGALNDTFICLCSFSLVPW